MSFNFISLMESLFESAALKIYHKSNLIHIIFHIQKISNDDIFQMYFLG